MLLDLMALENVSFTHFAMRAVAAAIAGLTIGLEREFKGKSAGLKTNAVVAVGASVFVMISLQFISRDFTDITRVLGQVVAGVGFLGAGVIIQKERREIVKGLTTAATIWCSAAVGCLAAMAMYAELAFVTLLLVGINFLIGMVDVKTSTHNEEKTEQEPNKNEN